MPQPRGLWRGGHRQKHRLARRRRLRGCPHDHALRRRGGSTISPRAARHAGKSGGLEIGITRIARDEAGSAKFRLPETLRTFAGFAAAIDHAASNLAYKRHLAEEKTAEIHKPNLCATRWSQRRIAKAGTHDHPLPRPSCAERRKPSQFGFIFAALPRIRSPGAPACLCATLLKAWC